MRALVITCILLLASVARAEGDAFLVLPAEDWGGIPLKAKHVSEMINLALVEKSLNVKPAPTAEDIAGGDYGVVCGSSAEACAGAVGRSKGATKVIGASLRDTTVAHNGNTTYELELSFYTLATSKVERKKTEASDLSVLVDWARGESLAFAGVEVTGGLVVTGLPVGTRVFADDVEKTQLPMIAPLKLRPGRHAITLKSGEASGTSFVDVKADETVTVKRCVNGTVIGDCDGKVTPPVTPDDGPNLALIGGGVGAGVGVVVLAVSGFTAVGSNAARDKFAETRDSADRDDSLMLAGTSVALAVVGGTLLVAGGAVSAASLVME